MTKYVYDFSEGNKDLKDLLGGKGANLAEMTNLGIPVPPGFTITTEACRQFLKDNKIPQELDIEVTTHLRKLEEHIGKQLGAEENPLLVSVRSGAKFSMPGMMETVLNIGLSDKSVKALAEASKNERFAWDSYRRLIQMFGKTVLDVDGELYSHALEKVKEEKGYTSDTELKAEDLKKLVEVFKKITKEASGIEFPQEPRVQLDMAIEAVFKSWNTQRAILYRRREKIPHDLGTAVNICTMVFGNMGDTSGTGVCFTRDPATGKTGVYGDYLTNAQGEDVVAGIRNTLPLTALKEVSHECYLQLLSIIHKLETHYRDLCDIEFTIEKGKLWMLQTRVGKRTAAAAFRVATQLVDEKMITEDEALTRVNGAGLTQLMFPQFNPDAERTLLTKAMPASPGAAVGEIVLNNEQALQRASVGAKVILVRRETNPDDLPGMMVAQGVLTARGGKTSHAAVVARGMGKTCVCGAEDLKIDLNKQTVTIGGVVLKAGDTIAIDGSTGEVFLGEVAVVDSAVTIYLRKGLEAGLEAAKTDDVKELVLCVDRMLKHADKVRKLGVRANADTPEDSTRALEFGAEGIGLCRTEHMFLGERRSLIEHVILSDEKSQERKDALQALLPLQKADFIEMFKIMNNKPVTVRLIDPPLHEFLPDIVTLEVKAALNAERKIVDEQTDRMLEAVRRMHEANPMLGLRGVRLGLVIPGLFELQIQAIIDAVVHLRKEGFNPLPEIMVPLVGSVRELQIIRQRAEKLIDKACAENNIKLDIPIGCMVELPRAAVNSEYLAEEADFFSFGTNDLTQTTWGFSRDDVEGVFFPQYVDYGIFGVSPFETIDFNGVGRLVKLGVAGGRKTKPKLKLGVCGEHGGDPDSINFFESAGLDYVSCSPFRVPIARLEAGRASVLNG